MRDFFAAGLNGAGGRRRETVERGALLRRSYGNFSLTMLEIASATDGFATTIAAASAGRTRGHSMRTRKRASAYCCHVAISARLSC